MRQYASALSALKGCALFKGMPDGQLTALLDSAPEPEQIPRGALLYGPEADRRALGILLAGTALVYRVGQGERGLLMSRLRPGDAFGMATLFHEAAFPTEIHAEQACQVLFLPKAWLEGAFQREGWLAANYIALLSERIAFLNRRIDVLRGDDLPARLLRLLASLPTAPDGTVALPFTLSQLAEMLGTSRASLYRTLDALHAQGQLRREGRRITLQSIPGTAVPPSPKSKEVLP